MSISHATGAAYARTAATRSVSSQQPLGTAVGAGVTRLSSGSRLESVKVAPQSLRSLPVTSAPPQREPYGMKDALKDVGRYLLGNLTSPGMRLALGLGMAAAGVALALTGVGLPLGAGLALGGTVLAGSGAYGIGARASQELEQESNREASFQPTYGPATREEAAIQAARKTAYMRAAGFDVDDADEPEPAADHRADVSEPTGGQFEAVPEPAGDYPDWFKPLDRPASLGRDDFEIPFQ